MNWFSSLFTEPGFLQAIILVCIICAAGLALGQIKVKGVSLGVTFVFFAGILMGDICRRFGIEADWRMISLAQNFGLIIFVYGLGVQVGPGFFASLKQGGIKLNMFGLLAIVLTTAFALIFYACTGLDASDTMGLLCGAVTNTPMLGAAQQAMLDAFPERVGEANNMATACAVGYPCGVLGVMICMIIMKFAFKAKEKKKTVDPAGHTYVVEFHVSNPAIFGRNIGEIAGMTDKHIIISRVWREGKVTIPASDTVIREHDHLLAVIDRENAETFKVIFGGIEATDWNRPDINWDNIDESKLLSKHILVTKKEMNGVKIGSLHLRNQFNINITRVNRAGIQLVAYPGMRLQLGDRLTVVGEESAIAKVGEILGNEEKELLNPNLSTIFIGVVLGVLLGMVPINIPGMSTAIKLGIAGGPIIVGILMGAFGPRFHLATYSTRSANLMLRQMGIVIYLACLGFGAGADFFSTVFCLQGLLWVALSLAIAIVPVLICAVIARRWGKLDYAQNAGMLCAAMANPMALTYANSVVDDEEASEAYATVYPLSMFIRVISAQLMMLLML